MSRFLILEFSTFDDFLNIGYNIEENGHDRL